MSDPLNHLLSVDLGESSLSDVFKDENKLHVSSRSKKPLKKVRFADDLYSQNTEDSVLAGSTKLDETDCNSGVKGVKGILKAIKASNSEGYRKIKGWAKHSPSVPVTVKIVSSIEDDTEEDVESFTGTEKCENSEIIGTMDEGKISNNNLNSDFKNYNDEMGQTFHHLNSLPCVEDDKHDDETYSLENNSEIQLDEFSTLKISRETFEEEMNDDALQTLCGENSDDDTGKLLVDEIRKMSKELFVKSASHLGNVKKDLYGSPESETLPDGSFISTDIVNDILHTQNGGERLVLQETKNSELATDAFNNTDKKLVSDGIQQNVETSSLKLGSRIRRPSSPHTMKLKRVLEEIAPEKPRAKDLRTIAFSAWCAIKADEKKSMVKKLKNAEKQTLESKMKAKTLKEASAINAFICWKEQKEKMLKLKRENEMKAAEMKQSKAQEDKNKNKEEADLVFKAWKKRKDEELKEQQRKQKLKRKMETMNKGHSEEMKKLDAAAAFNAWKSQKLIEYQRKEKECLVKKELETSLKDKERSERDKEALKAYELWLEYKEQYEDRYDWRNQVESKPPWSPPGRIA